MEKTNIKIIMSFFAIGVFFLFFAFMANETSDVVGQRSSQSMLAFTAANNSPDQNPPEDENVENAPATENQAVPVPAGQTTEQDGYVSISGIDFDEEGISDGGIMGILNLAFIWGIRIVIALALVFIVIGAVQYMTTDAIYDKKEGKERITAAIGGLILALVSWLILQTINPDILSSNFLGRLRDLEPAPAPAPQTVPAPAPADSTGDTTETPSE